MLKPKYKLSGGQVFTFSLAGGGGSPLCLPGLPGWPLLGQI